MNISIGGLLEAAIILAGFAVYAGFVSYCIAYGWRKGKGE